MNKQTKGAFGRSTQSRFGGLGFEQLENRHLLAVTVISDSIEDIGDWSFKGREGDLYALQSSYTAIETTEITDSYAVRWMDADGDIIHLNWVGEGEVVFTLGGFSSASTTGAVDTIAMGNMDITIANTTSASSLQILTNPAGIPIDAATGANGLADLKLIRFNDTTNGLDFGDFQTAQAYFSGTSGNVGIRAGNTSFGGSFLRVGDVSGSGSAQGFLSIGANSNQNTWQIFGGDLAFTNGTNVNFGAGAFVQAAGATFPGGIVVEADPTGLIANAAGGTGYQGTIASSATFELTSTTTNADLEAFFDGFTFTSSVTITVTGDPVSALTIGNADTDFLGGLAIVANDGEALSDVTVNGVFGGTNLSIEADIEDVTVNVEEDANNVASIGSITLTGVGTASNISNLTIDGTSTGTGDFGDVTASNFVGIDGLTITAEDELGDVTLSGTAADADIDNIDLNTLDESMGNVSITGNVDNLDIDAETNFGDVTITGDADTIDIDSDTAGADAGDLTITGQLTDDIGGLFANVGSGGNISIASVEADASITFSGNAGNITISAVDEDGDITIDVNDEEVGNIDITLDDVDDIADIDITTGTVGNLTVTLGEIVLGMTGAGTIGDVTMTKGDSAAVSLAGDAGNVFISEDNSDGTLVELAGGSIGDLTVVEGNLTFDLDGNSETIGNTVLSDSTGEVTFGSDGFTIEGLGNVTADTIDFDDAFETDDQDGKTTTADVGLLTADTFDFGGTLTIDGDISGFVTTGDSDFDLATNNAVITVDGSIDQITVADGKIIGDDDVVDVIATGLGALTVTQDNGADVVLEDVVFDIDGDIGNIVLTNDNAGSDIFESNGALADANDGVQIYSSQNIGDITITATDTGNILAVGSGGVYIAAGDDNGAADGGEANEVTNVTIGDIVIEGDLDFGDSPFGTETGGEQFIIAAGVTITGGQTVDTDSPLDLTVVATDDSDSGDPVFGTIGTVTVTNNGGGDFQFTNPTAGPDFSGIADGESVAGIFANDIGIVNGNQNNTIGTGELINFGDDQTPVVDQGDFIVAVV